MWKRTDVNEPCSISWHGEYSGTSCTSTLRNTGNDRNSAWLCMVAGLPYGPKLMGEAIWDGLTASKRRARVHIWALLSAWPHIKFRGRDSRVERISLLLAISYPGANFPVTTRGNAPAFEPPRAHFVQIPILAERTDKVPP